jgi:hypothetical protein
MCSIAAAFIGSTVLSAYGTYRQGQAQAQAAQFDARVAENNALAAEQQMQTVTVKEGMDKAELRQTVANVRAEGEVGYASAGVVVGAGSAGSWELSLTEQEQKDLATIEYNAALERNALQNQAQDYRTTGQARRVESREYRTAGVLGAGTSLLSGYSTYRTKFG